MNARNEIVQNYDAAKERGDELERLIPVAARVTRRAESVYSLRLTSEEMRAISAAAEASGVKLSQFIRNAALQAAARLTHEDAGVESIVTIVEGLRQQVTLQAEQSRNLQKQIDDLRPRPV